MKRPRIPPVLFTLSLLLAPGLALASQSRSVQEATTSSKPVTMTAEERSRIESTVLSDKRVRQIVGEEKPRILITDAETDKAEAEAFLAGTTDKRPSRRVSVAVFNPKTNKAAHVLVLLDERRILEVQEIKAEDVPFSHEDAEDAWALAKENAEVRRALGDKLEQFKLLDPGTDTRVAFAVQALPLRSTNPRDPCSTDRCLDLIFRTEEGYLPLRVHVDLTKRTVTLESRQHHEGGEHS